MQAPSFQTRRVGPLEWQVDLPLPMPWQHANEYGALMRKAFGGDWRLPSSGELRALFQARSLGLFEEPSPFWTLERVMNVWARTVCMKSGNLALTEVLKEAHVRLVRVID